MNNEKTTYKKLVFRFHTDEHYHRDFESFSKFLAKIQATTKSKRISIGNVELEYRMKKIIWDRISLHITWMKIFKCESSSN